MENGEQKLEEVQKMEEEQKVETEISQVAPIPEALLPPTGKSKKRTWVILGAVVVGVLAAAVLFYFLYLGHPSRQVLARVNGDKVTVDEFNRELAKLEFPANDMIREEPEKFIEGMILRKIVLQEAKKKNIAPPAKTYKDTDKNALPPDEALIAELMKKQFATPPIVTKQEIEAFYSAFKERMGGKSIDQVASAIEELIRQGKQQQEFEGYVGDLYRNSKVEINQEQMQKITAKPPESNTEDEFKKAMQSGKPSLVDFGANSCAPCRQIRPVLKEIGKEVATKASILVIDVYKYQDLARDFKVMVIPTLVFFDAQGKEVFRHVGVLEKEKIISKLKEIGMAS